jgi:hypothetical protein
MRKIGMGLMLLALAGCSGGEPSEGDLRDALARRGGTIELAAKLTKGSCRIGEEERYVCEYSLPDCPPYQPKCGRTRMHSGRFGKVGGEWQYIGAATQAAEAGTAPELAPGTAPLPEASFTPTPEPSPSPTTDPVPDRKWLVGRWADDKIACTVGEGVDTPWFRFSGNGKFSGQNSEPGSWSLAGNKLVLERFDADAVLDDGDSNATAPVRRERHRATRVDQDTLDLDGRTFYRC